MTRIHASFIFVVQNFISVFCDWMFNYAFFLFFSFSPLKFPKLLRQGMEEMNKYHKTDCLWNTTGLLIHTYNNRSFKIIHKTSNPLEYSFLILQLMKDVCSPVATLQNSEECIWTYTINTHLDWFHFHIHIAFVQPRLLWKDG